MKLDARIRKQLGHFQLDLHLQTDSRSLVLWGASGAGKTLTLNSLAGFSRPDAGRILLDDNLLFDAATGVHVPPQKRRCGYIFQDHALFPHMTVAENLRFAMAASGKRSKRKLKDLLSQFELEDYAQRKPAQLSGGQQQRAALARALAVEPRMLLLDEPTQGLDARLRASFFAMLRQTAALIVLVTHDLDECFEAGEYLCLLEAGKLLQAGAKDAVLARPASVPAAKLLGIYNVIPAEIEALDPGRNQSRLRMLGSSWPGVYFPGHLLGDKGFAVFRETSVRLSHNQSDAPFQVEALKPFARGMRLVFRDGLAAVAPETDWPDIRAGSSVHLRIQPDAIVFLSQ